MTKTENLDDRSLREAIRSWDPAQRVGDPGAEQISELRGELLRAAREREQELAQRIAPPRVVWATAAAAGALVLALVAALSVAPSEEALAPPVARSRDSVQMELTASNGVRIYWSAQVPNGT